MDLERKFMHKEGLVSRKVGDEMVIVPLRDNVADMDCVYTLNDVGAFIWDCMDGQKTVHDIIKEVVTSYEVGEAVAEKDVIEVLQKMDGKIVQ